MKMLNKISFVLMVIFIPLSIICISDTVVPRSADFYQYNLNDTQLLDDEGISADQEKLSALMADYLNGNTSDFQLKSGSGKDAKYLFDGSDAKLMMRYKYLADIYLILGIVLFVIWLLLFVVLMRQGYKEKIGYCIRISAVIFVVAELVNVLVKVIRPLKEAIYNSYFSGDLMGNSLLIKIFEGSFSIQLVTFQVIFGIIFMGLVWYGISVLTRPKRMFY